MTGIIDRFEGDFCVVELDDKWLINIEIHKVPKGAREGDVIDIYNDKISINLSETEKRKKRIKDKVMDLWE